MPDDKADVLLDQLDRVVALSSLIGLLVLSIGYFLLGLIPNQSIREFLQSISTNLIPVLLVVTISYFLFRQSQKIRAQIQIDQIVGRLSVNFDNTVAELTHHMPRFQKLGIINIHKGLDDDVIFPRIAQSKNHVSMLLTWLQVPNDYKEALSIALKKSPLKVWILLLEPDTSIAHWRSSEVFEHSEKVGSEMVRYTKKSFEELNQQGRQDVMIKHYKSLPHVQIIICDDIAFLTPFLNKTQSTKGPQLEIRIRESNGTLTYFGEFVIREFKAKWTEQ